AWDGATTLTGAYPTVFPNITGLSHGAVINTLTPTITWDQWRTTDDDSHLIQVALESPVTHEDVWSEVLADNATSVQVPQGILANGESYQLRVYFGNVNSEHALKGRDSALQFSVDTAGPRVTTLSPAPGSGVTSASAIVAGFDEDLNASSVHPATFTVTGSGGDGLFGNGNDVVVSGTVTYDAGTDQATFTPWSALPDDTYLVRLDATNSIRDLAGNRLDGEYVGTFPSGDGAPGGDFLASFTVDTTAPTVTVTPRTTSDTTPALSGTVNDPTAAVAVTVAGKTYQAMNNGNGTWTLADNTISPPLTQGVYDVLAQATDTVGNVGSDATTNELAVDTTPPSVTVTPRAVNDTTPALGGTVDDPSATVQVTVAGKTYPAVNQGTGTWILADNTISPALPEGVYEVLARAVDAVGNIGTDGTSNELTVDTTAPTVTASSRATNDATPLLSGTVNDPSATVLVTVGGATYTATNNGNGTWTLADNTISPPLAQGTYDVQAQATDPAGNVGSDATTNELTVDTTAPTVTVSSLTTRDTTPRLSGALDDPAATVQVTVGGKTYAATNNGNGTWALADNTISPALADGVYDVMVQATDAVGNVGADATTDELTVDTTPPIVTVTPRATNDTTPALTGTVNEPGATVQVTVGGNTYAATNNGDGTWTLADNTIAPALAAGVYEVQARATDAMNNVGTDAT
ncbi:MAG: hypothetical protein FJ279_32220, partial [Planctomycetes bacterium]|nr:hypothetical protein [Planctomycetota bacterium]